MPAQRSALLVALAALAAGCLAPAADETVEPAATPLPPALSEALPTFEKIVLSAEADPDPVAIATDALGLPREDERALDVPDGTSRMQIALDVQPLAAARPGDEVSVVVESPDGAAVFESGALAAATKQIAWIEAPAAGEHRVRVTTKGAWVVGLVAVFEPEGYTPGIAVNVSHPEQTEVDHTFEPATISAKAGVKTRITMFDYDPHAGVENLQHNLYVDGLGAKTEGRTTWGEVRTLDFTATEPGTYAFWCEYHEEQLRGRLVVS